jgi:hypothetical protein
MISQQEEQGGLMPNTDLTPVSHAPSVRQPSRIVFVLLWVLLHGTLLFALIASSLLMLVVATPLLFLSYAPLMRWYRPAAWTWGAWIAGGGLLWFAMATLGTIDDHLAVVVLGMTTGITTLPLLPWRGLRTACWPLINLLGGMAAFLLYRALWERGNGLGTQVEVIVFSGALYGLITGPVLAILLHDAHPTWFEHFLHHDQPTPE